MNRCQKLLKLIDRMEKLVANLCDRRDLVVHQRVNQFFYMQKTHELRTLMDQVDTLQSNLERLTAQIHTTYEQCANRWRHDARWLNSYRPQQRGETIL